MKLPLNEQEHKFMRNILKWDQKRASIEVIVNNFFLASSIFLTLYIAYKTIISLNDLNSLLLLLPGYLIGILLLSIYIVGDTRIKERRRYAAVIRKIHLHNKDCI